MESVPQIPDLTLLRMIGGGSYGDVWLARTLTGVYRAVKIVDRGRFPDARPFQRELEGITQFQRLVGDRPRQLALMHVGRNEAAGLLYYVMELADDVATGTDIDPERYVPLTLKVLHERTQVMPAAECIRIGVELARSLVELHAAGLIHRDIKLSNVIFVAGVPKLADIGLVSSSDRTLTSLGTPGYAPPEGAGTKGADVYGLGKVLYELATGCPPSAFPRLPPDLEAREDRTLLLELNEVTLRACDTNPRIRYGSIEQLLDDLLLLQAGRSVKELQRTRQRLKTARRVGGIAVLLALAVAGVLGVQNNLNLRKLATQETTARLRAEEDERLARYTADLHRAEVSLIGHDIGLARAALRRQIPAAGERDIRGLEWYALWNETAGDELRVLGEIDAAPVRDLALSPDDRQLAALERGNSRRAVSWDLDTGTRRVLAEETVALGGFTAAGSFAVGTAAGEVRLVASGAAALQTAQPAGGALVARAGDGRTVLLVAATGPVVRLSVWDVLEGREAAAWESEPELTPARFSAAALSRDGRQLAVSLFRANSRVPRYELQVWAREGAAWTLRFRRRDFGDLGAIAFAPDGTALAIAGAEATLSVLDARDGSTRLELPGHRGDVFGLAFTGDGALLASAGEDQTLRIWRTAGGALVNTLRGHEAAVTALVWSGPDRLLSASVDGSVREWDTDRRRTPSASPGYWSGFLSDFVFSPDGATIAITRDDGRLVAVDARTLAPTGVVWEEAFHPFAFTSEGVLAMSSELELVRCDARAPQVRSSGLFGVREARVVIASGSADGRFALLGNGDGSVEFWDCVRSRRIGNPRRFSTSIYAGAFAPDGSLAATGDTSGAVVLWDPATGRALHEFTADTSTVLCVAVSAERLVAVGREDGTLTVIDGNRFEVVARRAAHSRGLNCLAFSPDGARLVTAGYDGVLVAWSVPEYRELSSLPVRTVDETPQVFDPRPSLLRFSPDGSTLITFTEAGWLRRWDLRRAAP